MTIHPFNSTPTNVTINEYIRGKANIKMTAVTFYWTIEHTIRPGWFTILRSAILFGYFPDIFTLE
jgi:hypothetical protein